MDASFDRSAYKRIKQIENLRKWFKHIKSQTYSKVEIKNKAFRPIISNEKQTNKPPDFKRIAFESRYLHKKSTMEWLRRFKGRVPEDYLYLPKEKRARTELATIFETFDEDESGSLDLDEFVKMLMDNYIVSPIARKDYEEEMQLENWRQPTKESIDSLHLSIELLITESLKEIYSLITPTDGLLLEEFVNMCIHEKCNELLRGLMTKLKEIRDNPKTCNAAKCLGMTKYLPFSFENMSKNLCYQHFRQKLKDNITEEKEFPKKMDYLLDLMKLNIDAIKVPNKKKLRRFKITGKTVSAAIKLTNATSKILTNANSKLLMKNNTVTSTQADTQREEDEEGGKSLFFLDEEYNNFEDEFQINKKSKAKVDGRIDKFLSTARLDAKAYMNVVKVVSERSHRTDNLIRFSKTANSTRSGFRITAAKSNSHWR